MAEKIFWKFLGRSRKSIQFGKLDQKSLFFIWFFVDNGQKTYEKIRKNWIRKTTKLEKWGGGSWGEKVEFGSEKRAWRIFRWMKIDVLRWIFNLERSKKWDDSEKRPKMAEKIFWKIFGRSRKSIKFGKLDQKSLFFICFFTY